MNLVLSLEAIGCLMNVRPHPDFNHYAVTSLMKKVKPEIPDVDLECLCQAKRLLYEEKEGVIDLLINLLPDLWEGWDYKAPPTIAEIEHELSLRKQELEIAA